jgi:hypothetical protein
MSDLDPTAAAWLQAARAAKAEIARLEEIAERAISHVKNAMGDAEHATVNGKPAVTWAWSKPGKRIDRKALEADHGPEFVAKYLVDNVPARPFKLLDAE